MRVLQVVKSLGHGGAEQLVISLAEGLQLSGHTVAVAAGEGPWSTRFCGPAYELPLTGRNPLRVAASAGALDQAVRHFRPDIVHSHNPGATAATAVATLRGSRTPALTTLHGVPTEQYRWLPGLLRVLGVPVVACGPGLASELDDHGYRCWRTINNGIEEAPRAPSRQSIRHALGIGEGQRIVMQIARLVEQKNHLLAIHALARVPDAVLVCCGDGPLMPLLKAVATRLGVIDRVRFLGSRDDARQLLSAADLCTLSSFWEGLPLVLLEAMAARVPVVCTVPAATGLIEDGLDGLLVPPDNPKAMSDAWNRVLSDHGLAQKLSHNGRAKASEFTVQRMVGEYEKAYAHLVGRTAARALSTTPRAAKGDWQ